MTLDIEMQKMEKSNIRGYDEMFFKLTSVKSSYPKLCGNIDTC